VTPGGWSGDPRLADRPDAGTAPADADEPVRYSVADGVATLLLDRPEKRNALNGAVVAKLKAGLGRAAADREVRVVLLRGAGKDFCSGADLAELERIAGLGPEANLEDAASLGDLFIALRRHPKPVVAAVQGRALAGGCGLATACDLVLARDDAQFGYTEVHLGFVAAMVMAILRRKLGEGRAFELVALGNRIAAFEAERIGLVNRVIPAEEWDASVEHFAAELASRPPSAVSLTKRLLYGLDGVGFEDGIARGAEVNALARMTEACREGVRRFLARSRG
jgi:methylglutaconyl-CoA hydratase